MGIVAPCGNALWLMQATAVAGGAALGRTVHVGAPGLWLNGSYAGFPLGTLTVNL